MLENKGSKIWIPYLLIQPQLGLGSSKVYPQAAWYTAASATRFAPSSCTPTFSHSMDTAPKCVCPWLCKSSTCRQHLNAENKGSKIWTPYLLIALQLNPTQQPQHPEAARRQQRPQLFLAARQLYPNILMQRGHRT